MKLNNFISVPIQQTIIDYPRCKEGLIYVLINEIYRIRCYDNRLAISRWDNQVVSWDAAQEIKNMIWGEEITAIEYYPPQSKLVNKRNTRHLWKVDKIEHFHTEFEIKEANK